MFTPTATIGIRGTRFLVAIQEVGGNEQASVFRADQAITGILKAVAEGSLGQSSTARLPQLAATEPITQVDVAPVAGLPPMMFAQVASPPLGPQLVTIVQVEEGLVNLQALPALPGIPSIPIPPLPVGVGQVASVSLGTPPVFLPSAPPVIRGFQPPPSFSLPQPQMPPTSGQQQPPSSGSSSSEGCVVR